MKTCLKPQGLEYVASSSGPLPSLFKLNPWGQKWPHPGGHMFYIGLYSENHEKIFLSHSLKPYGLESWYLVWGIIWWTSTKFVQMAQLRGHMFYIGLYSEKQKNLLVWNHKAKNGLPRGSCGITCVTTTKCIQIMPLGPKMDPTWGSHVFHRLIWWKT